MSTFGLGADSGFVCPTIGPVILWLTIALIGFAIWKWRKNSKKLGMVAFIASVIGLHGQSTFGLGRPDGGRFEGRSPYASANSAVYNYVQRDPMQALGYVQAFGDTSSTSRVTASAMIDAGKNAERPVGTMYRNPGDLGFSGNGSGIATFSLNGSGGNPSHSPFGTECAF